MANLNYAQMYQEALDQKFTAGVKFSDLYSIGEKNANGRYKFLDGKVIQINTLTVNGMIDHDRDGISTKTRNYNNSWATYTMSHDRVFETLVDPADINETNMTASIANITGVFTKEHLFPEMDKFMSEKLFAQAGTKDTTALDATNILDEFENAMLELDNNEVPEEGRILYITPAVNALLKASADVTRYVDVTVNTNGIDRRVKYLDGVKIVVVPASRMKSAYDYTLGATAVVGAEDINFILVHPDAVVAPLKVDTILIDNPTATTGGKYDYFQRKYWDVFVLGQKTKGVYINYTEVV